MYIRAASRLLITLGLSVLLMACSDSDQTKKPEIVRPVLAMKVGDSEVLGGRRFAGRAKATQEVNLAFDVTGTLKELPVKVGDEVKAGQLLAKIDPRDYEADLSAAKARLTKTRSNFKRAKDLIKKDYISQTEYDRIEAEVGINKAEVDRATKALEDTVLTAPFDGRISEKFVENFQAVQRKQQIVRLVDTSQVEMIIDMPEALISYVPYAKTVNVRFDAFPDKIITAGIKEIATEASDTTRTYPVTLVMDQPEGITILPGMAGETWANPKDLPQELIEQAKAGGIVVNSSAVFSPRDDGKSYVWVINETNGTASKREVKPGVIKAQGILITDGLQGGEWVATAGVNSLREGQKVRIIDGHGE